MAEAAEAFMLVYESVLPKENRRTGQLPTGSVEIQKQKEHKCFDVNLQTGKIGENDGCVSRKKKKTTHISALM